MARFEMRFPEDLLARIDRARGDVPRATWIKRRLEKALGSDPGRHAEGALPLPPAPAPPRTSKPARKAYERPVNRKVGQRTPPRPTQPRPPVISPTEFAGLPYEEKSKERWDEAMAGPPLLNPELKGLQNIIGDGENIHTIDVPEESSGCAECGGDLQAHPEFGRFCTGCGARVR